MAQSCSRRAGERRLAQSKRSPPAGGVAGVLQVWRAISNEQAEVA